MSSQSVTSPKNNGRFQLLVILLTPLLVVASSTLLYLSGWLLPNDTTNHGYLLSPVLSAQDFGLPQKAITQERQWQLIQYSPACHKYCEERMQQQRQQHIALGKYLPRIERVLLTQTELSAERLSEFPRLSVLNTVIGQTVAERIPAEHLMDHPVFVVDPFGNVMLYFTSQQDYKAQMSDLKKLLKNSTIG